MNKLVDATRPFQAVYALHELPGIGLIMGSYIVEVLESGDLAFGFQRLIPENFKTFSHKLDPIDQQAVELTAQLQAARIHKQFAQGKKEADLKKFMEALPENKNRPQILDYVDYRMQKLAALLKGRPIYLAGKDGYPAQKRLHWNNKKARVTFSFHRVSEGTLYTAKIKVGREVIQLHKQYANLLTVEPATLILEDQLYSFNQHVDGRKLKPFFRLNAVTIRPESEESYFRKFLVRLLEEYEVEAKGLTIHNVEEEVGFRLAVSRKGEQPIHFKLSAQYGPHKINLDNPKPRVALLATPRKGQYEFTRVYRQLEEEIRVAKAFRELKESVLPEATLTPYEFDLPANQGLDWLQQHHDQLQQLGIVVEQDLNGNRYVLTPPRLEVQVLPDGEYIRVEADIVVDKQRVPLSTLADPLKKGQDEIPLDKNVRAIIPQDWGPRLRHFFEVGRRHRGGYRLPKAYAGVVESAFGAELVPEGYSWPASTQAGQLQSAPPPAGLQAELRDYQSAGYAWMRFLQHHGLNGILADDMGLGKTLQALAILQHAKETGAKFPSLVVVPNSLVFNWLDEGLRFTPNMRFKIYAGPKRDKNLQDFKAHDVILSTYGTVRQDVERLKAFPFHYIILDESQVIKNREAKTTRAINKLQSQHRLTLTGTPIENTTRDLWSQMNFLNPGLLGSERFFERHYATPIEKEQNTARANQLRKLINPLVLRRTKEQVARELPPRIEKVLRCGMTAEQQRLYNATKAEFRKSLFNRDQAEIEKNRLQIFSSLQRLRQIAIHPRLVEEQAPASQKYEQVWEVLEDVLGSGQKVLVFSQFVKLLTILRQDFEARGIRYSYLDGSTKDRKEPVEAFQTDPDIPVFLISLKAGGVGLNLTAAQYVFLLDPWWNPATEQQALNRAHRIGQTKTVFAYKFITADSIEEKILELQQRKSELAEDVIQTEQQFFKSLTVDDLRSLFE